MVFIVRFRLLKKKKKDRLRKLFLSFLSFFSPPSGLGERGIEGFSLSLLAKHSEKIYCAEKLIITNLLTIHEQLRVSDFDVGITVDT